MQGGIEQLQQNKFSTIIDESTDKSTTSQLALLGTYFNKNMFKMTFIFISDPRRECYMGLSTFIDLIELPNGKAETMYGKIKDCLNERKIPMENVIGFCADTCNVMFGKHHSVSQLLTKDYPWILSVKCSCRLQGSNWIQNVQKYINFSFS